MSSLKDIRQQTIDRLFKGRNYSSDHAFSAESGQCEKCGESLTNWMQEGGTFMCPVISPEELEGDHD